jgi:hypothetical protein
MSDINKVKDTVQEAKNDLEKEEQETLKSKVKSIIKATLNRIEEEENIIKEHQDNVSILRKDLKDLETGRLDLIEERQGGDPKARNISIVIVKKVNSIPNYGQQPWFIPFELMANPIIFPTISNFADNITRVSNAGSINWLDNVNNFFSDCITTTGSNLSNFAPGTYTLNSGSTIDIRPRF